MAGKHYLNEKSNMHSGHRSRLKEKFLKEGLDSLNEIQVLEMLLFYCIPQGDTNETAHALLSKYGSLSSVLDAPFESLIECPGIGTHTATFIRTLPALCRRYRLDKIMSNKIFSDREKICRYLSAYFMDIKNEQAILMCFDAKCRLICTEKLSLPTSDFAVSISSRRVAEVSLACHANAVVLAHNHPSGMCEPSQSDISLTNEISCALRGVGVTLIEHFVITDEQTYGILEHMAAAQEEEEDFFAY